MDRVIAKPHKAPALLRALVELTGRLKAMPELRPEAGTVREFAGLRVLLAEDNIVNQKLATRLLERVGAQVRVAGNGLEALKALAKTDFDVVLMDCQMPQLDGYEATRRLRGGALVRNPEIPVIALTAHALASDRAKCLEAGMSDYLTKPIDVGRLKQALARIAPETAVTDRAGSG